MTYNQKITFDKSGMDSDITPEYNKGFPLLKNVRILSNNDGTTGAVTTSNGNTLVEYTLPSGSNLCIGAVEDKLNQKIYYFVWNDENRHSILEYNERTNSVVPVLIDDFDLTGTTTGAILNFKKTNLITGDCVVQLNVDEGLLYWTDNWTDGVSYNEPKKINIQAGILFMAGTYTGQYSFPFLPKFIDRIKEPPTAPTYVWSGLNAIFIFTSTTTGGLSDPTTQTFPFNQANPNVGAEWDTTNYWWLVATTGTYYVTLNMNAKNTSGFLDSIAIYKNGVSIHIIDVEDGFDGVKTATYTLSVVAGDKISVVCDAGIAPSGTNLFGTTLANFSIQKGEGNLINYNYKRLYQFQCDWGYKDKERSVLSQKSNYILPKTQLNPINTTGEDYTQQDNVITITVPTGSSNVRDIRIYAHEINTQATDTISDTSLVITLNKDELGIADNTTYDYVFLNDGNYLPVNLADATQLMDFVPVREKALVFFKNRIADANVTEGQDAFEVDMRFPITYDQTVYTNPNSFFPAVQYLKSGGVYEFGQEITYGTNSKARISNVNTRAGYSTEANRGIFGTRVKIPFLTEAEYAAPHATPNLDMEYVPTVSCLIYNPPPADMLLYNIMASKNQAMARYLQFTSQSTNYEHLDGSTAPATSAYYVAVTILNISGLYKTENPSSNLVYEFTKGDRIRFIANRVNTNTIDTFFPFNDNEILSFDASTGVVLMLMTPTVPQNLGENVLFEIYTPAKDIENDNETMYEVGEGGTIGTDVNGNRIYVPNDNGLPTVNQLFQTFSVSGDLGGGYYSVRLVGGDNFHVNDKVKITNDLNHWSVYGVVSAVAYPNLTINTNGIYGSDMFGHFDDRGGTIVRASEQTFTGGDCFRRYCNMPFQHLGTTFRQYSYIETAWASNCWTSLASTEAYWFGRPNRIDNLAKRLTSGARVLYTEQLLVNSNVNGLSKIYDTNFQDYNASFGGINYLFYQNEALQAYQQYKVLPILVQQQNMQSPNGSGIVGSSTLVLTPQQKIDYYLEDFGIGEHPESWAYYGNRKYFIDVYRSAIVRLSNDGLVDITSEANMRIFMANLCKAILANPTKVNCVGVYDTRFGTYILSVAPFGEGDYANGLTIEFNEKYNQFTTTWSYVPDYFCQNGVDVVAFKYGALYTQNTNTTQNNWFGEQYASEIWFYVNDNPENNKILQTIKQRGIYPFEVTEISNQENQFTHLLNTNFKMKESVWYSKVYMDEHTPNIVASPPYLPNAIVTGNVMRSRWFLCKFKYSDTLYNKLFSIDLTYTTSSPTIG